MVQNLASSVILAIKTAGDEITGHNVTRDEFHVAIFAQLPKNIYHTVGTGEPVTAQSHYLNPRLPSVEAAQVIPLGLEYIERQRHCDGPTCYPPFLVF